MHPILLPLQLWIFFFAPNSSSFAVVDLFLCIHSFILPQWFLTDPSTSCLHALLSGLHRETDSSGDAAASSGERRRREEGQHRSAIGFLSHFLFCNVLLQLYTAICCFNLLLQLSANCFAFIRSLDDQMYIPSGGSSSPLRIFNQGSSNNKKGRLISSSACHKAKGLRHLRKYICNNQLWIA